MDSEPIHDHSSLEVTSTALLRTSAVVKEGPNAIPASALIARTEKVVADALEVEGICGDLDTALGAFRNRQKKSNLEIQRVRSEQAKLLSERIGSADAIASAASTEADQEYKRVTIAADRDLKYERDQADRELAKTENQIAAQKKSVRDAVNGIAGFLEQLISAISEERGTSFIARYFSRFGDTTGVASKTAAKPGSRWHGPADYTVCRGVPSKTAVKPGSRITMQVPEFVAAPMIRASEVVPVEKAAADSMVSICQGAVELAKYSRSSVELREAGAPVVLSVTAIVGMIPLILSSVYGWLVLPAAAAFAGIPLVWQRLIDSRLDTALHSLSTLNKKAVEVGDSWIRGVYQYTEDYQKAADFGYQYTISNAEARASERKQNADATRNTERRRIDTQQQAAKEIAQTSYSDSIAKAERDYKAETDSATEQYHRAESSMKMTVLDRMAVLKREVASLEDHIVASPYSHSSWGEWKPDGDVAPCVRIGEMEVPTPRFSHWFPKERTVCVPALVPFPGNRPVMIKANYARDVANRAVLSAVLRLLGTVPPGRLLLTFIDPIGAGQNVAGLMELGEADRALVTSKAWSEPQHIEEQLRLLGEHVEFVIQQCLRQRYATIADYNEAEAPQAHRVLAVFDYPASFSETAVRRLTSIVRNGCRCGVFVMIVADANQQSRHSNGIELLEPYCEVVTVEDARA